MLTTQVIPLGTLSVPLEHSDGNAPLGKLHALMSLLLFQFEWPPFH